MTLRCLSLHRKERQGVLFTSSVMVPVSSILVFILLHHIAVFKQCEILLLHSRTRNVSCCFLIILGLSYIPNSLILGLLLNSIKIMNKKRHRCTEQTFGLCGRRRGWDVSKEQHVYYL